MSDFLTKEESMREPLQAAFSETMNPIGLNGVEFIEYTTARPQALGQVLEMMGFRPIARHRSREVQLYRQGDINIVVNAHASTDPVGPLSAGLAGDEQMHTRIAAIALRVRDAQTAFNYVVDKGAWAVNTYPQVMELNIPAIHGAGGSRLYFVDRYKEFSIYDVDFVPTPGVDQHPPATAGMHFFGIVQYIGLDRSDDWLTFYQEIMGAQPVPAHERFGILPQGTLIRFPSTDTSASFMMQLIEPEGDMFDGAEYVQRIGFGVHDVRAAVKQLSEQHVEFVKTSGAHTDARGAITKTYEHGVVFEFVHSQFGVKS